MYIHDLCLRKVGNANMLSNSYFKLDRNWSKRGQ